MQNYTDPVSAYSTVKWWKADEYLINCHLFINKWVQLLINPEELLLIKWAVFKLLLGSLVSVSLLCLPCLVCVCVCVSLGSCDCAVKWVSLSFLKDCEDSEEWKLTELKISHNCLVSQSLKQMELRAIILIVYVNKSCTVSCLGSCFLVSLLH